MLDILKNYSYLIIRSTGYTLLLTLLALLFAMLIGLLFALCNVSKSKILNVIGTVYVDAVRGVPLIVLAFFIYFGIPQAIKMIGITGYRLPALKAGTIALSMNCGAYMAEIFRAGIMSILVKPIDKHEEIQIVLKRRLEWIVLFFYRRFINRH